MHEAIDALLSLAGWLFVGTLTLFLLKEYWRAILPPLACVIAFFVMMGAEFSAMSTLVVCVASTIVATFIADE